MGNQIPRLGNRVITYSGTGVIVRIDRTVSRPYLVRFDKDTDKYEWFFKSDLKLITELDDIKLTQELVTKLSGTQIVGISTKQIADLVVLFVDPNPSLNYKMTIQDLLSKLVESENDYISIKAKSKG